MRQSLPAKSTLTLLLICFTAFAAQAQQRFFEPVSQARLATPLAKNLQSYSAYALKDTELRRHLANAPLESTTTGTPVELFVPLPNGTTETFLMSESALLAPQIALQHPDIKTYTGVGKQHGNYTITITYTSSGFDALVLGVEGDAVYITKATAIPTDPIYLTYFARDAKKGAEGQSFGSGDRCRPLGKTTPINLSIPADKQDRQGRARNNTGGTLRTYRLAVAGTGEFTLKRGGGNITTAFNSLVAYVNRMNAVYKIELSVRFSLVSGTNVMYADTASDPYFNWDQSKMLEQNQTNLTNVIGTANYDVGHVFSYAGSSGGGLAASGSTCDVASKAQGVSAMADLGSYALVFDDQLVSHEVGHQFTMSHSFNSSIPVCTTREATTSVEPGAGATIMSYGFTCSGDDYEPGLGDKSAPFLHFHAASYQQAFTFMTTGTGRCNTSPATSNAIPVISGFPANMTIPKSTPFELSAMATDADAGDVLTYSWEGLNVGTETPTAATLTNTAKPPFFRSYVPVAISSRTFPRLSAILNGTNIAKGDKLPSVGIATTHQLTVRDNVGGLTFNTVTVTVDGGSGPFLVTNDPAGPYAGNSTKVITWDVANTTAPPVSCATVDILLSTDGGLTFPTTLLANTPNDGTEPITLPAVLTTTARVKVRGSGTVFFDISNTNFEITVAQPVELIAFRAEAAVNQVRLSWSTASEHNSDRFTVERSRDLGEFGVVGSMAAAGESARVLHYGLNDDQPLTGISYYRLKQADLNGKVQFSKPVAVNLDPSAPLLLVSPNPVLGTQIRYRLHNLDTPTISLLTLVGTPVPIQSITTDATGQQVLQTTTSLPTGVYVLRAKTPAIQLTQRVLVVD